MPEYIRHGPHGYCQRCGFKKSLSEITEDGEMSGLLVCDDCYDPPQPLPQPTFYGPESALDIVVPPNEQWSGTVDVGLGGAFDFEGLSKGPVVPTLLFMGSFEVLV